MSKRIYTLPVEQTQWRIEGNGSATTFNWDYDEGRDKLLCKEAEDRSLVDTSDAGMRLLRDPG